MVRARRAWRITALRVPGFIAATSLLTAAMLGNALASEQGDIRSWSQLALWRLGALAFALPLVVLWRIFAGRRAWRVLVTWLWVDALALTSLQISQLFLLFPYRPLDSWVTYVLPTSLFVVSGAWLAVVAARMARRQGDRAPASRS